jgi:hypothetical protein
MNTNLKPLKQKTRKLNNEPLTQFQLMLESETWEHVFKDKDTKLLSLSLFIYVSKDLQR